MELIMEKINNMGINKPEYKNLESIDWVNAQYKFHYGKCVGFFHNLFYRKIKQHSSREFADGSHASIFVCTKCNGIKSAAYTAKLF